MSKKAKKQTLSAQKWAAIDAVARQAAGKAAIEAKIKSSLSDKFARYVWFGCSNGSVVSVNVDAEPMTAKKLDDALHSVKQWKRRRAAQIKRDEAKLAREAEKKEAK
jgi:hypothetical protein